MRLADTIGIGSPRTGSTWPSNALRDSEHMPGAIKERRFFDDR